MEPYPSGQFGFIDDPDCQFANGSVWTRTRTRSHCPEPLLTLDIYAILKFSGEGAGRWRRYPAFSVLKYSHMPTEIQLVDRWKGKSKSRSMEGFNLIALYDVDEAIMHGRNCCGLRVRLLYEVRA